MILEGLRHTLYQHFASTGGGFREGYRWRPIEAAFKDRVLTGAVINLDYIEPRYFLHDIENTVTSKITTAITTHGAVKVNTEFNGEFINSEGSTAVKTVSTPNAALLQSSDLRQWYVRNMETILIGLDEFQERDSGWALLHILNLIVNVNRYNPMHAGCDISIPLDVIAKRAVLNVKSTDNACFAWAIVASLYPVSPMTRNPQRMTSYPHYESVLNCGGIHFPMTISQIKRFERQNNISVNVFVRNDESCSILPLRLTDVKRDKHVNLLYLSDSGGNGNAAHFVLIKNLSRLIGSQLSRHNGKKYICDR